MKENKNIQNYLDRELEPASVPPNERHWEDMRELLDKRSEKLRLMKIWQGALGIAIPFLILFGIYFLIPDSRQTNEIRQRSDQTSRLQMASILPEAGHSKTDLLTQGKKDGRVEESDVKAAVTPDWEKTRANKARSNVMQQVPSRSSASPASPDPGAAASPTYVPATPASQVSIQMKHREASGQPGEEENQVSSFSLPLLSSGLSSMAMREMTSIESSDPEDDILPIPEVMGRPRTRLQLIALAGPMMSMRQLSGSDTQKDYNKFEIMKSGMDVGLHMAYKLPSHFLIQSGLNYYSIVEELGYISDSQQVVSDNSRWNVVYNERWVHTDSVRADVNPTQWVYTDSVLKFWDSTYVADYDTSYRLHYRQKQRILQYLELPVLLTYERSFSRFIVGVQGGLALSYLVVKTSGVRIEEGRILEDAQGQYHHQWGLNAQGGCYVDYRLADHWAAGINPTIRLPLTSSMSFGAYRYRYYTMSVRLRLRYYF